MRAEWCARRINCKYSIQHPENHWIISRSLRTIILYISKAYSYATDSLSALLLTNILRIMDSKLLKKLEEIKKEYWDSEVCMGEMLDSVSADGFSIEDAHWLYMRAMEWANGDKFYIHIGEDEDVLSKDELEKAKLVVLE